MREVEIVALALPKMPNQLLGAHWRARSGHAKKWRGIVGTLSLLHDKPAQPLTSAVLTLTRVSSVEPDRDGLCGSFKSVIDALVKTGWLIDDTPDVIGTPTYAWEKGKRNEGHIKIKIQWEEK